MLIDLLVTAGQMVGGMPAGSLAPMAEAPHDLNDAASMGVALAGRWVG